MIMEMPEAMKKELKDAKTLNQVFAISAKYYDLDQPLGVASKIVVSQGMQKVINIVRTPLKK